MAVLQQTVTKQAQKSYPKPRRERVDMKKIPQARIVGQYMMKDGELVEFDPKNWDKWDLAAVLVKELETGQEWEIDDDL
jgi:hypothetical protein